MLRFWLLGTASVFVFVFVLTVALGREVGPAALWAAAMAVPVGAIATYGRTRRR